MNNLEEGEGLHEVQRLNLLFNRRTWNWEQWLLAQVLLVLVSQMQGRQSHTQKLYTLEIFMGNMFPYDHKGEGASQLNNLEG